MIFNPTADTKIEADDTLVVVGQAQSVAKLEQMMRG